MYLINNINSLRLPEDKPSGKMNKAPRKGTIAVNGTRKPFDNPFDKQEAALFSPEFMDTYP